MRLILLRSFALAGMMLGGQATSFAAPDLRALEAGRTETSRDALSLRIGPRESWRSDVEAIDFDSLRLLAQQGDAEAQFQLADAYWRGLGVSVDYQKAHEWLIEADRNGYIYAKSALGLMAEEGLVGAPDAELAAKLYYEAGQLGDDWGQMQLAQLYFYGQGVRQDVAYGLSLLKPLEEAGYPDALLALGLLHENGVNDVPDYEKAADYYRQAHAAGYDLAAVYLGTLYLTELAEMPEGEAVLPLLEAGLDERYPYAAYRLGNYYEDESQGAVDLARAREYYELSVSWGGSAAAVRLGEIYENGEGVEQDYAQGAFYYETARDRGNGVGAAYLGYLYFQGHIGEPDVRRAFALYQEAAEQGAVAGHLGLGHIYADGDLGEPNYEAALTHYSEAVALGSSSANRWLGDLYERGRGVEQDYEKAAAYYQAGIEAGDDMASAYLAYLYEEGLGVEADPLKASELYEVALKAGNSFAAYRLGLLYYQGRGVEGNDETALRYFQRAASDGYEGAYLYLGYCYHYGYGAAVDADEARYWYDKADAAGEESAKLQIALLLDEVIAPEQNEVARLKTVYEAQALYEALSETDPDALFYKARLTDRWLPSFSVAGERKRIEAYKEAADKGSKPAQYELARHYMLEAPSADNLERAHAYLQELAEAEWTDSYVYLGVLYDDMWREKPEAADLAKSWFLKTALLNNTYAQGRLLELGVEGLGIAPSEVTRWRVEAALYEEDADLAYATSQTLGYGGDEGKWRQQLLIAAAQRGSQDAQIKLAEDYLWGDGAEADYYEAVYWFKRAAEDHGWLKKARLSVSLNGGHSVEALLESGDYWQTVRMASSRVEMALNFAEGITVPQDLAKAEQLLRMDEEAWSGMPGVRVLMARILLAEDAPSEERVSEAMFMLEVAANSGNTWAQERLAQLYERGERIEQNYRRAALWYRIASKASPRAAFALAQLQLKGLVEQREGEDPLRVLAKAAEWDDPKALALLTEYWREKDPESYEAKRWARRAQLLN